MTLQAQLYTVDTFEQFIAQPENKGRRYELVHGTVVEKPMPTEEHGLIVARLVMWLMSFVEEHSLGRVVVETAYRRDDDALNRRIPDLSFTSKARLLPLTKKGAVPQMPDLAVEVKSPDDTYSEMREKANYYLNGGTKLVWLVFPNVQRIEAHATGGKVTTYEVSDTVSGGDVLPGFKLDVGKVFE